jgi:hypothetical protein
MARWSEPRRFDKKAAPAKAAAAFLFLLGVSRRGCGNAEPAYAIEWNATFQYCTQ